MGKSVVDGWEVGRLGRVVDPTKPGIWRGGGWGSHGDDGGEVEGRGGERTNKKGRGGVGK